MNIDKYLDNRIDTENGYCYKNSEAFENDIHAICYIPEGNCYDLDNDRDNNCDTTDEELKSSYKGYSRATLREVIAEFYDITEEEVVKNDMDLKVFGVLDWQCPETYLNEVDVEELYDE